jgi:5-methylthioadenosine/S-adenosylhomocysteine deaminase
MENVDLIIYARWVVPVRPKQEVLENVGVVVNQGRIVALLSRSECESGFIAEQVVERPHGVLMPGLINAHTHAAMSLLRGYADDLPLMKWLSEYVWPAEKKWVDERFVEFGAELAILEMIKGGTTCFNDMYFFPDVVAKVAKNSGIRASVGMIVIDFPTVWAQNADEYLDKGMAVHDAFRHESRIKTTFAPHAPYTVSDAPLERIRMFADELDVQIHMHIHETAHEVEESVAQYGVRPLERLDQLGLLSPRLQAVHLTQLLPGEIATLAERGVFAVHCPQSNMKLASGVSPVTAMRDAGVKLAIGTDGASSNNDLDMLAEMQSAAMMAKHETLSAEALPAFDALEAATLGSARALAIDSVTGSIESGKAADLVCVDLKQAASWPVYHPVVQLVYAVSRDQVSDVWVEGECLLKEGAPCRMNEEYILDTAQEIAARIAADT